MATLPPKAPVTPLRQRMLDDMAMRPTRARTRHDYVHHVRTFAAFLRRSPDTATAEDARRFQVHQREHGISESIIGATVSALPFLFGVTLDRPDPSPKLVLAPRRREPPDVLSVDEVARLLSAAPGIARRWALHTAPACAWWRWLTAFIVASPVTSNPNRCQGRFRRPDVAPGMGNGIVSRKSRAAS